MWIIYLSEMSKLCNTGVSVGLLDLILTDNKGILCSDESETVWAYKDGCLG